MNKTKGFTSLRQDSGHLTMMEFALQVILLIVLPWLPWRMVKVMRYYQMINAVFKSGKLVTLGKVHPIMGHTHLFSNFRKFYDIIIPEVSRTRKRDFGMWIFFTPIFGVCHPETIKVFLKTSAPKAKNAGSAYSMLQTWLGDGLLLSDGAKWHRNRRLLTPAFHYDILRSYILVYNQTVDVFLKNLAIAADTNTSIDIEEPVSMATLDTMLKCAFSYESHLQEQGHNDPYVKAIKALKSLATERVLKPWQHIYTIYKLLPSGRKWMKALNYVHEFDEALIKKRRDALSTGQSIMNKKRLDFLDTLLTAKDNNGHGLNDREIRDEVDTFLFEGHDTTASAIYWAIYHLGKHPAEQQKVYHEALDVLKDKEYMEWSDLQKLPVLTAFVKESMRLMPPVSGISRLTTDYTEVDGVIIPPNTEVLLMIHLMGHNPDVWPDCEELHRAGFCYERNKSADCQTC